MYRNANKHGASTESTIKLSQFTPKQMLIGHLIDDIQWDNVVSIPIQPRLSDVDSNAVLQTDANEYL